MCQAFSCLVLPDTSVVWRFSMDSHEDLIELAKLKDDTINPKKMTFCRVEISPKNRNYIEPDKWVLKIDQEKPRWWTSEHAKAAEKAYGEWLKKLNAILIKKKIVHPFLDIKPPKKITKEHLGLLKIWASIGNSMRTSVRASVWDSVSASVGDSVWASVGDSVGAYIGSFFNLPQSAWKYTENIKAKTYPFQPVVNLWMMGLVASFDGKTWRLHGGKNGKVLWEGDERAFLKKEK